MTLTNRRLIGLLTGLLEQRLRMGLSAHLEGVINGIFLVALGVIWTEVRLSPPARAIASCAALYGTYVNWLSPRSPPFSVPRPIAAAGHSGQPWQESLAAAGFLRVAAATSPAPSSFFAGFGRARW